MTKSFSSDHPENPYVIDAESEAEMARLIDQERLVTQAMGGPLAEIKDLSGISTILDIACGPGGWVLDAAHRYPEIDVTGIDISNQMIRYAQAYASVRQLPNAHFQVMDALQPLEFPDNSFDLVNARFVVGFVTPATLPGLLAECYRVLRPGGLLRLTEAESNVTNKASLETLWSWTYQAFTRSGRSFSPTGVSLGITPVIELLLRRTGFVDLERDAHVFSFSYGAPNHAASYEDLKLAFQLISPFLLKTGVTQQEELDRTYQQALQDMFDEDFCALGYLYTGRGKKPL